MSCSQHTNLDAVAAQMMVKTKPFRYIYYLVCLVVHLLFVVVA